MNVVRGCWCCYGCSTTPRNRVAVVVVAVVGAVCLSKPGTHVVACRMIGPSEEFAAYHTPRSVFGFPDGCEDSSSWLCRWLWATHRDSWTRASWSATTSWSYPLWKENTRQDVLALEATTASREFITSANRRDLERRPGVSLPRVLVLDDRDDSFRTRGRESFP